jgi:hypothetical protein
MRKWVLVYLNNVPHPVVVGYIRDDSTASATELASQIMDYVGLDNRAFEVYTPVVVSGSLSDLPYPLYLSKVHSFLFFRSYDEIVELKDIPFKELG